MSNTVKTENLSDHVKASLRNYWHLDDKTEYIELEEQDAVPLDIIESVMVTVPKTIKRLGQIDSFNSAIEKLRSAFVKLNKSGKATLSNLTTDIVDNLQTRIEFADSLLDYFMRFYDVNTSSLVMVATAPKLNRMIGDTAPYFRVRGYPACFRAMGKVYIFSKHSPRMMLFQPNPIDFSIKSDSSTVIPPQGVTTSYERQVFMLNIPLAPFDLNRLNMHMLYQISDILREDINNNKFVIVTSDH